MNDVKRRTLALKKVRQYCLNCFRNCADPEENGNLLLDELEKDPSSIRAYIRFDSLILVRKDDHKKKSTYYAGDSALLDVWCDSFERKRKEDNV